MDFTAGSCASGQEVRSSRGHNCLFWTLSLVRDRSTCSFQAAVKKQGDRGVIAAVMVPRELKRQMPTPHARRWMLREKQARLEIASAGNIGALVGVRDYSDNPMARVNASKALEQMLDNVSERTGLGRAATQQRRPGLQIVIVQPGGAQELLSMASRPPADWRGDGRPHLGTEGVERADEGRGPVAPDETSRQVTAASNFILSSRDRPVWALNK
jgi:hypothetical protein